MTGVSDEKLLHLDEPFHPFDLDWRPNKMDKGGSWAILLTYVTNRAIMERLDAVCGKGQWKNLFKPGPDGGIVCGISVLVDGPNGAEWVTKWDGAENTAIESIKGGLSGSMKRAAVQWGIGRYLYRFADEPPQWAIMYEDMELGYQRDGKNYLSWSPPALPPHFLPEGTATHDEMADWLDQNWDSQVLVDVRGLGLLTLDELENIYGEDLFRDDLLLRKVVEQVKNAV